MWSIVRFARWKPPLPNRAFAVTDQTTEVDIASQRRSLLEGLLRWALNIVAELALVQRDIHRAFLASCLHPLGQFED